MRDFVNGAEVTGHDWALKEDVRVTLVDTDPDLIRSTFLIERMRPWGWSSDQPRALVLTFRQEVVLINGQYLDLGDDLPSWCGLADTVAMAPDVKIGSSGIVARAALEAAAPILAEAWNLPALQAEHDEWQRFGVTARRIKDDYWRDHDARNRPGSPPAGTAREDEGS